jgi:type I restriction enzyme M protein
MNNPKTTKEEPLEKQLWKTSDKLRKNIDSAKYKHEYNEKNVLFILKDERWPHLGANAKQPTIRFCVESAMGVVLIQAAACIYSSQPTGYSVDKNMESSNIKSVVDFLLNPVAGNQ